MLESHLQAIRYKLQRRLRSLQRAETDDFNFAIRRFFTAIDSLEPIKNVLALLVSRYSTITSDDFIHSQLDQAWNPELQIPNEEEYAAFSYALVRLIATSQEARYPSQVAFQLAGSHDGAEREFISRFVEPVYEYIDEALDDERSVLAHLVRYKQRSEWFERTRLNDLTQQGNSRSVEKRLKDDLHRYLHDQGLSDVFREVHSLAAGIADIATPSDSEYPLIGEVKVFSGTRSDLTAGFHQAYIYAADHNRTIGHLIIYDTTERGLRFLVGSQEGGFPFVVCNNISVFLLRIDIANHQNPPSGRGAMNPHEITEQELIATSLNVIP